MNSPLYIVIPDIIEPVKFDIITAINHVRNSEASAFPVEGGSAITDHVINFVNDLTFTCWVTNSPLLSNPGVSDLAVTTLGALPYPRINPVVQPNGPLIYPDSPDLTLGRVGTLANVGSALNAVLGAVGINNNDIKPQPSGRVNRLYPPPGPQPLPTLQQVLNPEDRCQNMFNILSQIRNTKTIIQIITQEFTYSNMVLLNIASPRTVENGDAIEFSITARELKIVNLNQLGNAVSSQTVSTTIKNAGSSSTSANPSEAAQNEQMPGGVTPDQAAAIARGESDLARALAR